MNCSWLYRHLDPSCTISDYPKMYAGAMRLAKKYDATRITDTFASGLRKVFPSSFDHALRTWGAFRLNATSEGHFENMTAIQRQFVMLSDCRTDLVFPDAGALVPLTVYQICADITYSLCNSSSCRSTNTRRPPSCVLLSLLWPQSIACRPRRY